MADAASVGGDSSDRKTAAATRTPSARELGNALRTEDAEKVGELLRAGANPDAACESTQDQSGQIIEFTPLIRVVATGNLELVQLLLDHSADPNLRDGAGGTLLMLAAGGGHVPIVELLVKRGADIDAEHQEHGFTALHCACLSNLPDCAAVLVRSGCDATMKDRQDGRTGKQYAEIKGHAAVLERLAALESERFVGVVVRITGLVGVPEHNGERAAVRQYLPNSGRWEVELLCSGGKGIRVKPANMELALVPPGIRVRVRGLGSAAQHNGKTAVVTGRIGATGRCQAKLEGDGEQAGKPLGLRPVNMELLPPEVPDSVPDTAWGDKPERKAAGRTSSARQLGEAVYAGDAKKVEALLRAGANPNAVFKGHTPFGQIVECTPLCSVAAAGDGNLGNLEIAQLLLDHSADPNLRDGCGNTPLMAAAVSGQMAIVELLLKRGADIDATHQELVDGSWQLGATALHYACNGNQPDCAAALVRNGCDATIKNSDGMTGKQLAEMQGHTAVLKKLRAVVTEQLRQRMAERAQGDAEPDPEPAPSTEAFVEAIKMGDAKKVGEFLRAGANPNAEFKSQTPPGLWETATFEATPLSYAAGDGNLEIAQLLLDHSADPNLRDSDSDTALMAAASCGYVAIVELLLKCGADIDAAHPHQVVTAFHAACLRNQPDCAAALVRSGCDTTIKDANGRTGKQVAEMHGHTAVLEKLRAVVAEQLQQGMADTATVVGRDRPDRKTAAATRTPLAREVGDALGAGDAKKVEELLRAGANPNGEYKWQGVSGLVYTLLSSAAGDGNLEIAQLLLDHNADPNLRNSNGTTPLMLAAGTGHVEIVELLIKRGADVYAAQPDHGSTALHFACMRNEPDCVAALVQNGCDATIKDRHGRTGKQFAEMQGHVAVLERLRAVVAQGLRQGMAEQQGGAEPEPEPEPEPVSLPPPPDDIPTTKNIAVTEMLELLTNLNLAHHFDRLMENEIDMTSLGASS